MFFAFSPFAISRACVAVRKLRKMSSWQVLHSSDPTNSAPGMLGGARIVRFVVLQESKMTAIAAAPPAPHKKVSRLPWIHRASLEPHTNAEYAQNEKVPTTHFFRFFLAARPQFYRCWRTTDLAARNCVGDSPDNLL